MLKDSIGKHLPLSEATYYIMLSLVTPLHGYGVMQEVKKSSKGTVEVGPGTLYGVLSTLEKEGLIHKVREEDRRKYYTLSRQGKEVLQGQVGRLKIMTDNGIAVTNRLTA